MNFLSVQFLVFLPAVTALHFVLPPRARRWLLLLASLYFYGVFSVPLLGLMVATVVLDHFLAIAIEDSPDPAARWRWLMASVVRNLAVLGVFKYLGFFGETANALAAAVGLPELPVYRLILPMGISFYTFQSMSYTIDVYRGEVRACRSVVDTVLFVTFFPQLVAGPIMRSQDLLPQFSRPLPFDPARLRSGALLVVWGLGKKAYVADPIARLVNEVYAEPGAFSWLALVLATYGFAVQIYCDFSAYSDVARGAGRMLGYEIMINFDTPYLADSLRDFWRRWHISLSTWLRDYLYVPLGGNRGGAWRTYRNLAITMVLGGLWHGASWNFVIWGALHGGGLAIERALGLAELGGKSLAARLVRGAVVFHFVCLAWVFFRADTFGQSLAVVGRIATLADGADVPATPAIVLAAMLAVQAWLRRENVVLGWFERHPAAARWALAGTVLLLGSLLSRQAAPDFIYFQF